MATRDWRESCLNILSHVAVSSLPIESDGDDESVISVSPGVGCFFTDNIRSTPHIFENYLRLLRSVPQMILFIQLRYVRLPFVDRSKRLKVKLYGHIYHLTATFGYAERKNQCLYRDVLLLAKELYQIPIPERENQMRFILGNEEILLRQPSDRFLVQRVLLHLYSLQKTLSRNQSIDIGINAQNTIRIGIIAEL